jgi:hypothetical protein
MWVLFTNEIFIEPMRLFYLETYSCDGFEFFRGYIDYEATVSMGQYLTQERWMHHDRSSRMSSKEAD